MSSSAVDGVNKETKEWLELAVLIAMGAAFIAGISAIFHGQFAVQWLYAVVAIATLCASGVGTVLLYGKWETAPALWYLAYFFFIAPICLYIAFAVLDSLVGR